MSSQSSQPGAAHPRQAEIEAAVLAGVGTAELVRRFGIGATTAKRYRRRLIPAGPAAAKTQRPEPQVAGRTFSESPDGTATVSVVTNKVVQTLDDAVKAAEVDLMTWYVHDWEVSAWSTPLNVKQGQTTRELKDEKGRDRQELGWEPSKPIQQQQYRVRLKLKRIVARAIKDALDLVFASFRDTAPRWPKIEKTRAEKTEPYMAVFGLFDVHFGKLAWAPETGEHYDLAIAENLFRNAVADLIAESAHRRVAKVLLPVGNDWFHIDNRSHTTTRGTSQDVDGRFSKVLATGIRAAAWAVETLAAVAPVQVELVPGNHDRTLAECLCHVLAARFHHSDRVEVGLEPKTRKYVRYGVNLIGLAHGDLVKPDKLPSLMPADNRQAWAETTTREWLTGHGHRSQKWTTLDTDTQEGVVVRQLRALTRTDLWHFDQGHCGQSPAAEVYWYGRDRGYAGHAVVPARA